MVDTGGSGSDGHRAWWLAGGAVLLGLLGWHWRWFCVASGFPQGLLGFLR